jgi:hypothetical protein
MAFTIHQSKLSATSLINFFLATPHSKPKRRSTLLEGVSGE